MNKKIIVILICMILLTTVLPVMSVKVNESLEENNEKLEYWSNETIFSSGMPSFSEGRAMIKLIQELDETLFEGYLENLTSIGPRTTGTQGCEKAAQYLYNELENMNLEVRYQNWTSGGLHGKNIEATLNGADISSDSIYVICGHYDSVPECEGADDNGAGTVSVLTAAKVMSQYSFDHTIRFVLFSGEEQGLLGSHAYAKEASKNKDNLVAVLNVDMTGYVAGEETGSLVKVYRNIRSNWIAKTTTIISEQYHEFIGLEVISNQMYAAVSDHYRFWQSGYDTIFYYEDKTNPNFHTPKDTIKNMNITYATKVAKLAMATLAWCSSPAFMVGRDTLYVDDDGSANYSTIQDAIDNATIGDTVYVYNGTYSERIIIDKPIDVIGENKDNTVISCNGYENVILMTESWVFISGFTIQNTRIEWSAGVDILSNHNIICRNSIVNNHGYGIGIYGYSYNNISHNHIENNTDGICLWFSSTNNIISENYVGNNEVCGIALGGPSQYNVVSGNTIVNNMFGIYLQPGNGGCPSYNTISKNEITGNNKGMHLIGLSKHNCISHNNITYNQQGISLFKSNFNNIKNNNFIKNSRHVFFENAYRNKWSRNYWDNRTVKLGPKIIFGQISLPWRQSSTWINIDWSPARQPHKIEL